MFFRHRTAYIDNDGGQSAFRSVEIAFSGAEMSAKATIQQDDVLLVVDVQNDFCAGGALAIPDGDAVVDLINRLSTALDHVILTQDWHPPGHVSFASSHSGRVPFDTITLNYGKQTLWPDHCVHGTHGAEFHSGLRLAKAELVLRKGFRPSIDSYSAFYENDHSTSTGLAGYLRERSFHRIFLAGLAYDFCVRYSAEDAKRAGFEVCVIEDACRAIDLDGSRADTKRTLSSLGIIELTVQTLLTA
jgi:nicotinamidase/pyrazinamidase